MNRVIKYQVMTTDGIKIIVHVLENVFLIEEQGTLKERGE